MIQKNKSQKSALLKYLLSAPLFMLMLILSSATLDNKEKNKPSPQPETGVLIPQNRKDIVFTTVEQEPSFPGGINSFSKFLVANIKYPSQARAKNVEGKVFISFIVEENGSLSDIKIVRDIGYGCGKEALRVMKLSPKWKPGIQNGHKVRVQYTIPISYTLKG